jgi:hypothetical protein
MATRAALRSEELCLPSQGNIEGTPARARASTAVNDGFAGGELALFAVDGDRRGPVDDEDQHVALVVDVLGRPGAVGPRQQRRVQVLRCLPSDGAAASALRLGGGVELGRGEPFDQREQLPLLEADVGLEPLAELAHDRPDVGAALERADECVELLVVEQGLDEQRSPPATRRRVGRAGGSSRISAVVGEGELDRLIERQ